MQSRGHSGNFAAVVSKQAEPTRLAALDGLRAVAALLVVLTHVGFLTGAVSSGLLGRLLGRGDFGVGIFFALSGFLLHSALLRQSAGGRRPALTTYALRRAARILPAYWLALAVVLLAVRPDPFTAVVNVLVAQIYVPGSLLHGFTQTWSLSTEVSFYVALPFVFLGLRRLRRRAPWMPLAVLVGSWVAGLVLTAASSGVLIGGEALMGRWLPAHWATFALGMILAEVAADPAGGPNGTLRALSRYPGTCLAVSAGAYLLATTPVAGPLTLGPVTGLQLALKMVLSCAVAGGLLVPLVFGGGDHPYGRALASPAGRYLGDISYGVFLWHLPVFEAMFALTGADYFTGGAVPLLAVGLPLTLGLAALSHRYVEVPLMDRAHAWRPARR